ncbi:hypothetical protein K1W69_07245 [Hoeflea sp. WL0058]|uniref:Uncharacterized protein n=1 Tax=Flavimaribacter sediminis TaxID=2865987 RepID=A0AAE2ZHU3_9HYPH|nr:hypothetical protein [Flavimaribacter sediminis]MBW8636979.1 hypothetical protein [Flavimaribacter sediminis]
MADDFAYTSEQKSSVIAVMPRGLSIEAIDEAVASLEICIRHYVHEQDLAEESVSLLQETQDAANIWEQAWEIAPPDIESRIAELLYRAENDLQILQRRLNATNRKTRDQLLANVFEIWSDLQGEHPSTNTISAVDSPFQRFAYSAAVEPLGLALSEKTVYRAVQKYKKAARDHMNL